MRLKGGSHIRPPQGYVEAQRSFNWRHQDGSLEGPNEADAMEQVVPLIQRWGQVGSVLDVGCRAGASLAKLESLLPDARVVGVDVVPEFVEHALERGLEAQVADAHSLPFDPREFDWVTCVGTFEHFYDVRKALGEMVKVARRGVYVTCDLRDEPLGSDFAFSSDVTGWREVMEESGLDIVYEKVHDGHVEFVLARREI